MALITCPDCGKRFSEFAKCCPNCGCPSDVAKIKQAPESKKDKVIDNSHKTVNNLHHVKQKKNGWGKGLKRIVVAVVAVLFGIGIYWLIDKRGDEVIDLTEMTEKESAEAIRHLAKEIGKYDYIGDFHEGMASVHRDNKAGFINVKGEEVIPCIYDDVCGFSEGYAAVRKNDLWGYINTKGEEVIPCKYIIRDEFSIPVGVFSEGIATVYENGKWGCINAEGKTVIPCKYDHVFDFHEGMALVKGERGFGYINETGEEIIPFIYEAISSDFSEGLALVKDRRGYSYINKTGDVAFDCINREHRFMGGFHNGLALVESLDNFKYGFINKEGKIIITYEYDVAKDFSEGLALVVKDNKVGFIDVDGKEVIPLEYEAGSDKYGYDYYPSFSEGLVNVCKNDKWGYINKQGNVVIPFRFDYSYPFSNGLARVGIGEQEGFVDKYGNSTLDKR